MPTPSDESKCQQIAAMYERSRQSFPEVAEITAEQLVHDLKERDDVVLVDVRTPEEQVVSMIEGAITAGEFEQNQQAHEASTVVVYCTVGHRSGLYAKDLVARGRSNVYNLKGAILSWTHAGGSLVNIQGPTTKLHVHSKQCNLTAQGYEAIW